jgi:hypothetical protein
MQGEYTFEVESGSTMPKSVFARREQIANLYQMGAVDQLALLNEYDIPNKEQIIQRMSMGQLGVLLEKLQIAGMSEELLAQINEIANMDDNTFKQLFTTPPPQNGGNTAQ